MEKTFHRVSQAGGVTRLPLLARGLAWGLLGGLCGTLVMDLLLMAGLSAAGLPALTCFSIVGDTLRRFFAIAGVELVGGIPAGITTHYLVGPLFGLLFGGAVTRVRGLRVDSLKKGIALAVLYVEILSQPLLAMTPLLLKMTTAETIQWYGFSTVLHLLMGVVLGAVVSFGLRELNKSPLTLPPVL